MEEGELLLHLGPQVLGFWGSEGSLTCLCSVSTQTLEPWSSAPVSFSWLLASPQSWSWSWVGNRSLLA